MSSKLLCSLFLACIFFLEGNGQTDTLSFSQLLSMELNQITKVKVLGPAAITSLTQAEVPASITVISQEDISNSPARNIYDLIETFVPGATWLNHEDGPHMAVRGVVVNRNFKYLLLVNGRILNNKAHFGAKSELEMWDMGDIHRIEIIRGPGSVTYGPGAVGGVINIIINDTENLEGFQSSVRYVSEYEAKIGSIGYAKQLDKVRLYSYASVAATPGSMSDQYLVTGDNEFGAIGRDINLDDQVMEYVGDYKGVAQVKAHLGVEWGNWEAWTRYTQQGSNWRGNEVRTEFPQGIFNLQGTQDKQFTALIARSEQLSETLDLAASLSFDSYDTERRTERNRDENEPDHPLNKRVDFAEHEVFLKGVLNWKKSERLETAFGIEYSWDRFGVGWGDDPTVMRLGDEGNIINGLNSQALREGNRGSADRRGDPFLVGTGWSTNTFSFFAELNTKLAEKMTMLASARMDKNDFSEWLFSPRVAFISNFKPKQYLKLIAQQSARMNTASQLFIDNENGIRPANERIRSLEGSYSAYPSEKWSLNVAGYLNGLDVLAFEGNTNMTIDVGDLELWGTEVELEYKAKKARLGFNYSFLKQISWRLAEGVNGSGISYADYQEPIDGDFGASVIMGYGNDLNNWPNQSLKFFGTYQITKSMKFYADTRYQFDYQGAEDGLTALQIATTGTSIEQDVKNVIGELNANGVYAYDFRLNMSLHYDLIKKLRLSLFAQNLTSLNDNKRYAYDNGNDDPAPRKVRFMVEPRTFAIRLAYNL